MHESCYLENEYVGIFTPCNEFYETGGLLPSPKDLNNGNKVVLQTVARFMASQPPPNVPPTPQKYGLIKGLLTIGFPL